jgi:uncharacterized protein
MTVRRRPALLPTARGGLYVLELGGDTAANGMRAAIVVPPFAEEMNRSRRMMVLAGEALAARGFRAYLYDPSGTGDSGGEFADARLVHWREDALAVAGHARAQGARRIAWIGVRFGALLAAEAADADDAAGLALWQPTASGRAVLAQFARLETAARMLSGDRSAANESSGEAPEEREIAGYALSRALTEDLSALELDALLARVRCPIAWFEMAANDQTPPGHAARRSVESATTRGVRASVRVVAGPAFWSTTEITVSPALIEATCEALAA